MRMKILLIVGDVAPNLNFIPEIRHITGLHQALVLSGTVTDSDVFDHAQRGTFDVVHIGAHKETYDKEDLLKIARVANAKLVFLNQCNSGQIGSFLVSRGVAFCIVTNVELEDREAWKMPLIFYEYLSRQERNKEATSFATAYSQADSGDGEYSFLVHLSLLGVAEGLERRMTLVESKLDGGYRLALTLVAGIALLSVLLTIWGILT